MFIGCRDLDIGERKVLKEMGVTVFTMHEIDRYGMPYVIEKAIELASDGTDGIHVSFDVDSLDPMHVKGTGTRVYGGLTYREANFALEMISLSQKLVSAEFVEVNPIIDNQNVTAKTAVALMGSLLGEWLILSYIRRNLPYSLGLILTKANIILCFLEIIVFLWTLSIRLSADVRAESILSSLVSVSR